MNGGEGGGVIRACGGGVVVPEGAEFVKCWVGEGEVKCGGSAVLGMREEGVEAGSVEEGKASFEGDVENGGRAAEFVVAEVSEGVSVGRL